MSDPNSSDTNTEESSDAEVPDVRISEKSIEKLSKRIAKKFGQDQVPIPPTTDQPPPDPMQVKIDELTQINAQLLDERKKDYLSKLSKENQEKFKDSSFEVLKALSESVPEEVGPSGLPLVPQQNIPQSDKDDGVIGGYDLKEKKWKKTTY